MMKLSFAILPIFLLLMLSACGSKEDKLEDAMLSANIFLSTSECQKAIDVLEEQGDQPDNGRFLQILASAYACRAGFKETSFFVNDLENFGSPAILGGATKFSTSKTMDAPDNDDYEDLQYAIDLLLYAGGIDSDKDPTVARREALLSDDVAMDINAQLLYMIMAQIGKFLYYYGNADANGVKGAGTNTNKCILTYDDNINVNVVIPPGSGNPAATVTLGTYLDAATGSQIGNCNSSQTGHTQLGSDLGGTPLNYARLCQGVVLVNNFLEIFPAVVAASTSGSFDSLGTVLTAIQQLEEIALDAKTGMDSVVGVLSQERCELENTDDNPENIQIFYALMMESLFK